MVCILTPFVPAENGAVDPHCAGDLKADRERLGMFKVRGEREATVGEV